MNQIYSAFDTIFSAGAADLQPYALKIFMILATIDLFYSFIMHVLDIMLGGGNPVPLLFRKVLLYGAVLWLIRDYSDFITTVMEGFVQIGAVIGGGGMTAPEIDPEKIFDMGITILSQVSANFAGMVADGTIEGAKLGIKSALSTLPFGGTGLGGVVLGAAGGGLFALISVFIIALGIFICFTILALQLCLTLLEFKIVGSYFVILLPFLVFKPLSFLGEKGINVVVGFGMKLSVIVAVATGLSKVIPLLDNITETDFVGLSIYLGGVIIITWLSWQTSALTASLMSGGSSLTAGGLVRSGVSSAGALVAAGTMAAVGGSKFSGGIKNIARRLTASMGGKFGGGSSNTNSSSSSASSSNSENEQSSAASDSNVLNSKNAGLDNYSEKSRGTSDKNNEVGSSSNNANNSSQQKGFSPETKVNGKPAENSNKAANGNSNTSSKASPEAIFNSQSSSNGISSNNLSNNADSSVDSKSSGSVFNSSGQNTNSDAGGRTNSGSSSPSGGSGSVRSSGVSTSGSEANTSKSTLRGDSRSSQKGFSSGTQVNGKPVENKSARIQNIGDTMQNILNKTNAAIPEEESPK